MKEKLSLNLDEMLLEDVKKHLEDYGNLCKERESDDYAEINCDVKRLCYDIVSVISDYLQSNNIPAVYVKTAEITSLGYKTVYRHLNR